MNLKKHRFNIFPEMQSEDYQRLKSDIQKNGYDNKLPITVFQGEVIDGWNRLLACKELSIEPSCVEFSGNEIDAISFIMRTNKRRNLTSSQWAAIAVEAEDMVNAIAEAVEAERRRKQAETQAETMKKPIPELIPEQVKPIVETRAKLAEMFNTNPRYISEAQRLKETKPEVHKQVIRGEKTITEVKKEEKQEAKQVAKQQRAEIEAEISKNNASDPIRKHIENISDGDWFRLGGHLLYCGDTSSLEFKNGLTTCALAIADPPYNAGVAEWDNEFEWRHDYIAELAKVTVVTPGISSLFDFAKKSNMPYAWSVACWISNGMTRGKIGFGNWIYGAIFSKESIHRNEQDFLKISIQGDNIEHKGQKPVAFISWIIELFSDENDVVIDPFGGTGTTLLICEKMNRKCVIGEKDPESCKKIIARWELATGREAEKI